MQHEVTFKIDTDSLQSYTDEHISSLWHIAQANPAPITDRKAGELAEAIGREIIRRWMRWAGAPLWNHQGRHHYSTALSNLRAMNRFSAISPVGDGVAPFSNDSSEVQ